MTVPVVRDTTHRRARRCVSRRSTGRYRVPSGASRRPRGVPSGASSRRSRRVPSPAARPGRPAAVGDAVTGVDHRARAGEKQHDAREADRSFQLGGHHAPPDTAVPSNIHTAHLAPAL